ncbi:MAG: hypothetical protein Q4B43_08815 [Bacteroidota bacterium]|nr:hypothetical protein [Bacteroidota bacterium]
MKTKQVPQDNSNLSENNLKELCYATDELGQYTTTLSSGWEPKTLALDLSIKVIEDRIQNAKYKIQQGKASPILYYMELYKMDYNILGAYVNIHPWIVRLHTKPFFFKRLSLGTLRKYAEVFKIEQDTLLNFEA